MHAAQLFEDMHRRCDALLDRLDGLAQETDWNKAETVYGQLRTAMRAHFEAEEEELFPAFEQRALINATSTAIMRREHQRMNGMMDYMGGAIAVRDAGSYAVESQRLRSLLRQHARKEDFLMEAVFGSSDRDVARDVT